MTSHTYHLFDDYLYENIRFPCEKKEIKSTCGTNARTSYRGTDKPINRFFDNLFVERLVIRTARDTSTKGPAE